MGTGVLEGYALLDGSPRGSERSCWLGMQPQWCNIYPILSYHPHAPSPLCLSTQDIPQAAAFLAAEDAAGAAPLQQYATQLLSKAAARMQMRSAAANKAAAAAVAAGAGRGERRAHLQAERDGSDEEDDEEEEVRGGGPAQGWQWQQQVRAPPAAGGTACALGRVEHVVTLCLGAKLLAFIITFDKLYID